MCFIKHRSMKAYGAVEVQLPGETTPGTIGQEGLVGPRAGLDAVKRNLFALSGFDLRFIGRSGRSQVSVPSSSPGKARW
jgi:hypothetical protein